MRGVLLIAVSNVGNSVSRILMGLLADKICRQNTTPFFHRPKPFGSRVTRNTIVIRGNHHHPRTEVEFCSCHARRDDGSEHYASVNLYFIRGCDTFMGTLVGGLLLPNRNTKPTSDSRLLSESACPAIHAMSMLTSKAFDRIILYILLIYNTTASLRALFESNCKGSSLVHSIELQTLGLAHYLTINYV